MGSCVASIRIFVYGDCEYMDDVKINSNVNKEVFICGLFYDYNRKLLNFVMILKYII